MIGESARCGLCRCVPRSASIVVQSGLVLVPHPRVVCIVSPNRPPTQHTHRTHRTLRATNLRSRERCQFSSLPLERLLMSTPTTCAMLPATSLFVGFDSSWQPRSRQARDAVVISRALHAPKIQNAVHLVRRQVSVVLRWQMLGEMVTSTFFNTTYALGNAHQALSFPPHPFAPPQTSMGHRDQSTVTLVAPLIRHLSDVLCLHSPVSLL